MTNEAFVRRHELNEKTKECTDRLIEADFAFQEAQKEIAELIDSNPEDRKAIIRAARKQSNLHYPENNGHAVEIAIALARCIGDDEQ